MSVATGKDIESICGKCGDTWHVVVAKVGDEIRQVQCKECSAVHRYRPLAKNKVGAAPKVRAAGAPKEPKAARTSTRAPQGPLVAPDPLRPIRIYKAHFSFALGDTIDHATFGRGVVEAMPAPDRIQVYFEGERRVLVQARGTTATASGPGLALPPRRPPNPL